MSAPDDLELWDVAAATYAASVGGDGDSFYRRMRGFLGARFGDVSGLDVLDLGCGHGWLAEELRVAGARVTGVDGSNALLAEARERFPHVTFVQHDLSLGLPKDLGRYDRVVAHIHRAFGLGFGGPLDDGVRIKSVGDRPGGR